MPIKDDNQNPLEILAEMSGGSGRKHPVPQNVMDVEFKVVGDLTLRQLGYLCFGGMGAYIFYNSGLPSFWALVLAGLSIILAVAVAFIPIEERGLDKWLVLFIRAMTFETQLIWRKSSITPAYFLSDYADIIKNEIITLTPVKSRNKLDEYLGLLPEDPDDLDMYQNVKLSAMSDKFENQMSTPTKLASDVKFIQKKQGFSSTNYEKRIQITKPKIVPEKTQQPQSKDFEDRMKTNVKKVTEITKKETIPVDKISEKPSKKVDLPMPAPILEPAVILTPKPKPTEPVQSKVEIKQDEIESKLEFLDAFGDDTENTMEIINSTKVDRPIESWPKKYDSEIRGEIKIRTTAKLPPTIVAQDIKEIKQQEGSLEKKIEELLNVASRAKKELEQKGLSLDNSDRIEFFRSKYHELKQEKENLTTELSKNTSRVNQIDEDSKKRDLEGQVNILTQQNEELEEKLKYIQEQLFILKNSEQKNEEPKTSSNTTTIKDTPVNKQATPQSTISQQSNTSKIIPTGSFMKGTRNQLNQIDPSSNIIYGTIKDNTGGLAENTVVLIKDIKGNVVRALKTNKLGQFKTQTPVSNGSYLIEAVKGGENFDIIRIEANGKKLNPVYLIGKPK